MQRTGKSPVHSNVVYIKTPFSPLAPLIFSKETPAHNERRTTRRKTSRRPAARSVAPHRLGQVRRKRKDLTVEASMPVGVPFLSLFILSPLLCRLIEDEQQRRASRADLQRLPVTRLRPLNSRNPELSSRIKRERAQCQKPLATPFFKPFLPDAAAAFMLQRRCAARPHPRKGAP